MRSIAVLVVLFTLCATVESKKNIYAIGNLQTVINGETLFSTDIREDRNITGNLWCQIKYNEVPALPSWARFIRLSDGKEFIADISDIDHRAYLHFGQSSAEASGKYRCELKRAAHGEIITGNMFAFSHPTVRNNASWSLKKSEKEGGTVEAPSVFASYQTTAFIDCPIIGFPYPKIVWYKDKFPLEYNDRISFNVQTKKLRIEKIEEGDAGVYRCVGSNSYSFYAGGPEQYFEINLDQELRVGDSYGWMLPLAVIIIILLLLFLVIFVCQRCTQYKADHYNVAERERALHNDQVPLKNSV